MKFFCDGCNAKYSIADEKVRGKVVRVRCKRCEDIITVTEQMDERAGAEQTADDPSTSSGGPPQPPGHSAGGRGHVDWYYSIDGENYGPFDEEALVEKCRRGEVGRSAYVWNDSFSDWKPAKSVEPFQSALPDAGPSQFQSRSGRDRKSTMGVTGQIESIEESDREETGRRSPEGGSSSGRGRSGGASNEQHGSREQTDAGASSSRNRSDPTSRERNRDRKRRRNRDDNSGKEGRKERLDRLRNKLKSNFGPGGSDDETDDPPEPEATASGAPEDSGLAPSPEQSGAERDASGSASFSEPFGDEITDEDTVESAGETAAGPEDSFSEPFDDTESVEANLDPEDSAQDLLEQVDGEETFEASRDELAVDDAAPPDERAAGETGGRAPEDDAAGDFELPPAGSSRRGAGDSPDQAPVDTPIDPEAEEPVDTHPGLFDDTDEGAADDKTSLPTAPTLGDDDQEGSSTDSFADSVSQSLLMQIDKIQDEGKGKRYAAIGVTIALVLAAIGGWYYVRSTAPEQEDKLGFGSDEPDIVTENTDGSGTKTYSKEEREKILTISPQKVEAHEAPEEAAESGDEPENKQKQGTKKRQRVAKKDPPESEKSNQDLRLRGLGETEDDGRSMDEALEGAKKRSGAADEGDQIDRKMDNSQGATASSAEVDEPSLEKSRDFEAMEAVEGSSAKINRDRDEESSGAGGGGGGLPGKLDEQQIRDGIKTVRSSVGTCRARHAKRGVPIDVKKVYMTVTVQPSGSVTDFDLEPDELYGTVFEKCLHSHKGRWSFGRFEGSAQKMKAPFILQ